jgi:hypothetical protein
VNASLFVMKVPEFAPLVEAARGAGAEVRDIGDYLEVGSPMGTLTIPREPERVRPAIWFAALTGGFTGTVIRFDDHELVLGEER